MSETLKIKKTLNVKTPAYATRFSGCFDFYVPQETVSVTIPPKGFVTIDLGIRVEIPIGFVMKIYGRSGLGFKHQIRLSNCTGIIDADYRKETIKVQLFNDSEKEFTVNAGDRVCQGMLERAPQHTIVEALMIDESVERGGGFGSTGGFADK